MPWSSHHMYVYKASGGEYEIYPSSELTQKHTPDKAACTRLYDILQQNEQSVPDQDSYQQSDFWVIVNSDFAPTTHSIYSSKDIAEKDITHTDESVITLEQYSCVIQDKLHSIGQALKEAAKKEATREFPRYLNAKDFDCVVTPNNSISVMHKDAGRAVVDTSVPLTDVLQFYQNLGRKPVSANSVEQAQPSEFQKQDRYRTDSEDPRDYIDKSFESMPFPRWLGAIQWTIGKYFERFGEKDHPTKEARKIADYAYRFYEKVKEKYGEPDN